MIDKKDREVPRFPPRKEAVVRRAIGDALSKAQQAHGTEIKGIAAGACGGDILFHELCLEKNMKTEMFLPLPTYEFKKRSVAFAGPEWEARFDALLQTIPVHILKQPDNSNIWDQGNKWMFEVAARNGKKHMTVLALWDIEEGNEGGTGDVIAMAKKNGVRTIIIDIKKL